MPTIKENAMTLLKAMYEDWTVNVTIFSRDGLAERFGSLIEGSKPFIAARQYLVEKGLISELPGSQMPRFRMHAKGVDLIEG